MRDVERMVWEGDAITAKYRRAAARLELAFQLAGLGGKGRRSSSCQQSFIAIRRDRDAPLRAGGMCTRPSPFCKGPQVILYTSNDGMTS